jgi:hypothetical protein
VLKAGVIATSIAATASALSRPAIAQSTIAAGGKVMSYGIKPLAIDPKSIKGNSEKALVSHYENNYVGAVKRLNVIQEQFANLDFAKAPNCVVNGFKREELVAMNSTILREFYFDGLGGASMPKGPLADAIARDFGSFENWKAQFAAMGKAIGGRCSYRGCRATNGSSINGQPTTPQPLRAPIRSSCSTCTSTPIIWTMAPKLRPTSMPTWRRSAGKTRQDSTSNMCGRAEFLPFDLSADASS